MKILFTILCVLAPVISFAEVPCFYSYDNSVADHSYYSPTEREAEFVRVLGHMQATAYDSPTTQYVLYHFLGACPTEAVRAAAVRYIGAFQVLNADYLNRILEVCTREYAGSPPEHPDECAEVALSVLKKSQERASVKKDFLFSFLALHSNHRIRDREGQSEFLERELALRMAGVKSALDQGWDDLIPLVCKNNSTDDKLFSNKCETQSLTVLKEQILEAKKHKDVSAIRRYLSLSLDVLKINPSSERAELAREAAMTCYSTPVCQDFYKQISTVTIRDTSNKVVLSIDLESLEPQLEKMAYYTPAAQAQVLLQAAAVASQYPMEMTPSSLKGDRALRVRLFLLNTVAAIIESTTSKFYEDTVIPTFKGSLESINRANDFKSLVDIPRDQNLSRVAITMFVAGIKAVKPLAANSKANASLDALTVAAGKALAGASDEFAVALKDNQSALKDLTQSSRTVAIGNMLLTLSGYFEGIR